MKKNKKKKILNTEILVGILEYLGILVIIILRILAYNNISIGCNFKPGNGSNVLYPNMKAKIINSIDFCTPFFENRTNQIPHRVKRITNRLIINVYFFSIT